MAWNLEIRQDSQHADASECHEGVTLRFIRTRVESGDLVYMGEVLQAKSKTGDHIASLILREMYFPDAGIDADGVKASITENNQGGYLATIPEAVEFWGLRVSPE